jgi:NAD(P)-dependent dehydrogenase (short-subunit alcohol dehydrogenase family)
MARAGWDVAIHYRQSREPALALVAEIETLGQKAVAIRANLGEPDDVALLFESASQHFPNLRGVINNASMFSFDRPENSTADLLRRHYDTNLIAPTLLTQKLHQFLAAKYQEGEDPLGVVIHLLDQKLENQNPDFFSYTLSKSALQSATTLAAMAFAPVLRVVGVAPGITLPSADQTSDEFKTTHAMTPLGASSRPEEVADAVVWLAQARAVTGTMLLVDGGQHLMAQSRDVMMAIRQR